MDRNEIPAEIRELIGAEAGQTDTVGMSAASVISYETMVLKVSDADEEAENEAYMLQWLQGKVPVPKLLAVKKQYGKQYLLMERVQGEMSCAETYMMQPEKLTRLLAEGIKMLWQAGGQYAASPEKKPQLHRSRLSERLRHAEYLVREGLCETDVEPDTYGPDGFQDPADLLAWLKENQPEEDLVLSHGDYCLPNVFIKDDQIAGFIDLGKAGMADRYQDIALCYRSLKHNAEGAYGGKVYEGFQPEKLFEELGIEPDWEKVRYYLLLDELF